MKHESGDNKAKLLLDFMSDPVRKNNLFVKLQILQLKEYVKWRQNRIIEKLDKTQYDIRELTDSANSDNTKRHR